MSFHPFQLDFSANKKKKRQKFLLDFWVKVQHIPENLILTVKFLGSISKTTLQVLWRKIYFLYSGG